MPTSQWGSSLKSLKPAVSFSFLSFPPLYLKCHLLTVDICCSWGECLSWAKKEVLCWSHVPGEQPFKNRVYSASFSLCALHGHAVEEDPVHLSQDSALCCSKWPSPPFLKASILIVLLGCRLVVAHNSLCFHFSTSGPFLPMWNGFNYFNLSSLD